MSFCRTSFHQILVLGRARFSPSNKISNMCILIAPVRDTWSHVTARVVSRVNIVTVVEYVRWFLNWRGSWYRKIFIVVRK